MEANQGTSHHYNSKTSIIPPEATAFTAIFLIWVAASWFLLQIRPILYEHGLIPALFQYDYANYTAILHLIFIFSFLIFARIFWNTNPKPVEIPTNPFRFNPHHFNLTLLTILLINSTITLYHTGPIIFSANYYERMHSGEIRSAALILLPKIIIPIFFYNTYTQGITFIRKHLKAYSYLLFTSIIIDMLSAGRGVAFLVFCFSLIILTRYLQQRWGALVTIITSSLGFVVIYLLGQLFNAIRWYGTNITYNNILLQFNADAFNEMRSYAIGIKNLGDSYGNYTFGYCNYLSDITSRILPGFLYSLFGFNRLDYWNSSWINHIQFIFYPHGQQTIENVGIRVGLIGETDFLLGRWSIFIVAAVFAWLLTRSRHKLIYSACAIYAIPYGLTSLYMPIMVFITIAALRVFENILESSISKKEGNPLC